MSADNPGGNLNEVREILFGEEVRQQDARIRQLETLLAQQEARAAADMEALRQSLTAQINALESRLGGKIEAMAAGQQLQSAGGRVDTLYSVVDDQVSALRRAPDSGTNSKGPTR